ncbi:telomerase reverse transcriptase/ribonuclease HI, partial [Trypanosoma cruzi]
KEAGPSPHDLRTFAIGYSASSSPYGSELIWAVATDPARNEMQKTHATLVRTVSGVPSTTDKKSALLQANTPSLHVLCLRTRFRWSGCGNPSLCLCLAQVSAPRRYLSTNVAPSWMHTHMTTASPRTHHANSSSFVAPFLPGPRPLLTGSPSVWSFRWTTRSPTKKS